MPASLSSLRSGKGTAMSIVGAGGLAQRYALGDLHPVNRVASAEASLDRLSRALVYSYRQGMRRIRYADVDGDGLALVDLEGEVVLTSEDGTVAMSRGTIHDTRQNVLDLSAPGQGCPNAVSEATAQNGDTTVAMEGCDTLEFSGRDTGTYVRTRTYGDNTPSAKKLQDLIVATPELGTQAPDYHITIRLDDGTDGVINIRKGAGSPAP